MFFYLSTLHEHTWERVHSLLGEAAFAEAWTEGRAMTFDRAVAYALEEEEAPPK